MKSLLMFTVLILLLSSSCQNREEKLREKEQELSKKEQALLFKEKELQLKEKKLTENQLPGSDSLTGSINSNLSTISGLWTVTMTCIETDCEGSAVGDIKTERWDISYKNGTLLAEATVNDKLTRTYWGKQNGNVFDLNLKPVGNNDTKAKMLVKLKPLSDDKMDGRREIYREGCRIIYSLELEKQ